MAYSEPITVNVAVNASPLTQVGFGTPLFIATHRASAERVLQFTSVKDVSGTFPAGSNVYIAAQAAFSQTPSPSLFMVGRREADWLGNPLNVADGISYTITITYDSVSVPVTYVAEAGDTEEQVVQGFIDLIQADAALSDNVSASLVGSDVSSQLLLSGVDGAFFTAVPDNADGTFEGDYVSNEDASSAVAAIANENNDWYFLTSEDHTLSFSLGLAAEAQSREKLYFAGSEDQANLGAIVDPEVSLFGQLQAGNYTRTAAFTTADVDSKFYELSWISGNAPFDAGSVTWCNMQLEAVPVSTDSSTGKKLSTTQKSNLLSRNANFIDSDGGVDITRTGITSGGEWIDVIRGADWLTQDMTTELRTLLYYQKGGKISYDPAGINQIKGSVANSLNRAVNRAFITEYTINVPDYNDISTADKLNRVLNGITWSATLSGAIQTVTVNGTLTV